MQAIARRRCLLYQGSLSSLSFLSSRFLSLLLARHFFINPRKLGIAVSGKPILLSQSNKIHSFKLNLKLINNNKDDDNIVTTNLANSNIKKLSLIAKNRYNQRQYLWHQRFVENTNLSYE